MATALRHWLGAKKYRMGQAIRALAYRTPTPVGRAVVNRFWEEQAAIIHKQWGEENHDFAVLETIFAAYAEEYQPLSVLDVGCGSGRLFGLYQQCGITDIVGMDISENALALAGARYPTIPTFQGKVEELEYPTDRFTFAICNRILQHIPPAAINGAIGKLCTICRMVYVNELTESDQLHEEFFMFRHDYQALFAEHGFRLWETGVIGKQTYSLYGAD
ncbi:MAG: class I SAM-dependent methyltransferase [Caldilineaceae bacterium]